MVIDTGSRGLLKLDCVYHRSGKYKALKNEVIPYYKQFLEDLKRIQPTGKEVARLHRTLVDAAETMYQSFQLKMVGIEQKDAAIIRLGNSKIVEGRKLNNQWRMGLNEQAKNHGVKRTEDKGQKRKGTPVEPPDKGPQ